MGKFRISDRISSLADSKLHFDLPRGGKSSLFSISTKSYPSLSSSSARGEDEDTDVGYESSWSEIFRATNGVTYIKRQRTNK